MGCPPMFSGCQRVCGARNSGARSSEGTRDVECAWAGHGLIMGARVAAAISQMTRSADGQVRPQGAAASAPRSPDWRARRAPQDARPSPAPCTPRSLPAAALRRLSAMSGWQPTRWRRSRPTGSSRAGLNLLSVTRPSAWASRGVVRRQSTRLTGVKRQACPGVVAAVAATISSRRSSRGPRAGRRPGRRG
jgi:hypothetical protein